MKLTISKINLLVALRTVAPAAPSRASLPVLSNVLISATDAGLVLAATNLEMAIMAQADATVDAQGKTTASARLLTDLVASFDAPEVEMELDAGMLKLRSGGSKAQLTTIDAGDFPPVNWYANSGIVFAGGELPRILDMVTFAASTDEARPVLHGVQVRHAGNYLTWAATDGFRVSVVEKEMPGVGWNAIIPAKALAAVAKLAAGGLVTMSMSINSDKAHFTGAGWALSASLIDGNFPDYTVIMPKKFTFQAEIARNDVLNAIARAYLFRGEKGIVRMAFEPGRVTVTGQAEEAGNSETVVDCKTMDALEVAFNVTFIRELLSTMTGETVTIQGKDGKSPVMFTGSDADFRHVLMPMHVG